jgi:hypothetical protein
MAQTYWHELTDEQIKEIIDSKITYHALMQKYAQPDWCGYPEALSGMLGCWSLCDHYDTRHKISPMYCKTCDCFIKKAKG